MTELATALPDRIDLHAMNGDKFRAMLLHIHNVVVPDEPVDRFDADKNYIGGGLAFTGEIDGAGHRFPRGSDKAELLDYTLAKAQEAADPEHAAAIAATGVVRVHPFTEGNGRTVRALYKNLVRGAPVQASNRPKDVAQDDTARAEVDFGEAWDHDGVLEALRDQRVCYVTGVDYERLARQRVVIHRSGGELTELERVMLNEVQTAGLTSEEIADLTETIGADKFGNTYGKDGEGLRYAVTALLGQGCGQAFNRSTGDSQVFNLQAYLEAAPVAEKKLLVAKLWEYRKESARACVDLLADDVGGAIVVPVDGQQITIRDFILGKMNRLKPTQADDRLGKVAIAGTR